MDKDEVMQTVCEEFFRSTLGLKSHKVLQTLTAKCKGGNNPIPDQCGTNIPPNKIKESELEDIDAHIMSYDPSISHYRRTHAPKRLYLPDELSIASMFHDYKEHGGKLSCKMYRRQVKKKNIGFTKLGNGDCEQCLEYQNHICQNDEKIVEEVFHDVIQTIEDKAHKKANKQRIERIEVKDDTNCCTCLKYR